MDINRLDLTSSGFASKVANFHREKISLTHPEEAQQFWAQCQRRLNFDLNGKKVFLKTHNAALKFAGEKFPTLLLDVDFKNMNKLTPLEIH